MPLWEERRWIIPKYGGEASEETPEIEIIYEKIIEVIMRYRGEISLDRLLTILRRMFSEVSKGSGEFIILNGDTPFRCYKNTTLVAPKINPEYALKVLNIAARCLREGSPLKIVILLTNKLNSKIEFYTDMIFDTLKHLKVNNYARLYIGVY